MHLFGKAAFRRGPGGEFAGHPGGFGNCRRFCGTPFLCRLYRRTKKYSARGVQQENCHGKLLYSLYQSSSGLNGILERNLISRDMEAAVSMAGLAYIVNVILDEKKQIQAVFVGD